MVYKEIIMTKLKPEGKKMIDARDFLNGINKEKLINQKIIWGVKWDIKLK